MNLPEMTERQLEAWPKYVARASEFADEELATQLHRWDFVWEREERPGRGHDLRAIDMDGERIITISLDVYGGGSVYVAELSRVHDDADEDCACERDEAERAAEREEHRHWADESYFDDGSAG